MERMQYWIQTAGNASWPTPHPDILRRSRNDPTIYKSLSALVHSLRGSQKQWYEISHPTTYVWVLPSALSTKVPVGPQQEQWHKSSLVVERDGEPNWLEVDVCPRHITEVVDYPLLVVFLQAWLYSYDVPDLLEPPKPQNN
eukprot:5679099-Amphidinium_carterae.1